MSVFWSGSKALIKGSHAAGQALGRSLQLGLVNNKLSPSRKSRRRGILVPGDGPPSGSLGSFLDYREVLTSEQVIALRDGPFPIGRIQDPGEDAPSFAIGLDWGHIARHVAVVGPAGTGKTFNIFAPWTVAAARQNLGVIAVDVKGDFLQEVSSARKRAGDTTNFRYFLWDVKEPAASRSWNPLNEISSKADAIQLALAFLGRVDPQDHQKYFAERDHRWLAGLIWLTVQAYGASTHPETLYVLSVRQEELVRAAQFAPAAALDVADLIQLPAYDFSQATSGLANRLSWLSDPALNGMLAGIGPRSMTMDDVLDAQAVLVVGCRAADGARSPIAAALMLNSMRLKVLDSFARGGVPLLWILDEANRYADRVELDVMLDLMRGASSPICLGLQDVTQLGDEKEPSRYLANCDALLTLAGASHAAATFLSKRLGQVQAAVVTKSIDPQGHWLPTVAHQTTSVLGEREIMHPPVGQRGGTAHLRSSSPHPFLFSFQ